MDNSEINSRVVCCGRRLGVVHNLVVAGVFYLI